MQKTALTTKSKSNPFRPGAGHQPFFLAGRETQLQSFAELLGQEVILQNLVVIGRRGIGKTSLLQVMQQLAGQSGWLWSGSNLSEATSVNEESIAVRILSDLAKITSSCPIASIPNVPIGFTAKTEKSYVYADYHFLLNFYRSTPGLVADKLKAVLEVGWQCVQMTKSINGVVLAYDEAQLLSDNPKNNTYCLSLLIDVFQHLQTRGYNFLLVMAGMPSLLPKLVTSRSYADRMFKVISLDLLTPAQVTDSISISLKAIGSKPFSKEIIAQITDHSQGYPYFVQYYARDVWQTLELLPGNSRQIVDFDSITAKLDLEFFDLSMQKLADQEQRLLVVVGKMDRTVFSVGQLIEFADKHNHKIGDRTTVTRILNSLINKGMIFKAKRGSYEFNIPGFEKYLKRRDLEVEE